MAQAIAGVIAELDESGTKAALDAWDAAVNAAEEKAKAEGKKDA